jgi:hypothetical protein
MEDGVPRQKWGKLETASLWATFAPQFCFIRRTSTSGGFLITLAQPPPRNKGFVDFGTNPNPPVLELIEWLRTKE